MTTRTIHKRLGTRDVFVAGVALVVASSTLVSEFTGFFALGAAFVVALCAGFVINLLLAVSAADLSMAYPRGGAIYEYARSVLPGRVGGTLAALLGLGFVGMFAFASAGETASGAYGLGAMLGVNVPVQLLIVVCTALAVIPNLFGLRAAAWASAALLAMMLSIRWLFGIAGFLGVSRTGAWSAANLTAGDLSWLGPSGVLSVGLALAVWSFVGIEFACSLAHEVDRPRREMPMGLMLGLVVILATAVVMGLGVTGTMPLSAWRQLASGELGAHGDAPQLAVGSAMFGRAGYWLMSLASFSATLGTLTVAYAAIPRIVQSVARDAGAGGAVRDLLAREHPRTGAPVGATLLVAVVFLVPSLFNTAVVEWTMSAAYAWMLLYVAFHALSLTRHARRLRPYAGFDSRWAAPCAAAGVVLTSLALYAAFAGSHRVYGTRALLVLTGAGVVALIPTVRDVLRAVVQAVRTGARPAPAPCPVRTDEDLVARRRTRI